MKIEIKKDDSGGMFWVLNAEKFQDLLLKSKRYIDVFGTKKTLDAVLEMFDVFEIIQAKQKENEIQNELIYSKLKQQNKHLFLLELLALGLVFFNILNYFI